MIKEYQLTEQELIGLPKDSKVTISKDDLLVSLEKNNYHQINTAKDLGVVKSTVGALMTKYGIKKIPRTEQVTPPANYIQLTIPKENIESAIDSHTNMKDAANYLGVCKDKLYEYIKYYNIPTKFSKNKEMDWDAVRKDLFENRLSLLEVCKKYNTEK